MEKYRIFFFFVGDKDKIFFYSYLKLKKLEEVVVDYFKLWNGESYLVVLEWDRVVSLC